MSLSKDFAVRHLIRGVVKGILQTMFRVIFPGTFDPPTNGHLNVLQRAAGMFDAVEVVVASNPGKASLFSPEERSAMMVALSKGFSNVKVTVCDGLIVEFADRIGVNVILRGVRALADFDYEFELSQMNRSLNAKIETIFLPTDPKYSILRSSAIKEVALLGGDVSGMVPPMIARALMEKVGKVRRGQESGPGVS
jgi:pantetheine-phosphate adenylyltransferase